MGKLRSLTTFVNEKKISMTRDEIGKMIESDSNIKYDPKINDSKKAKAGYFGINTFGETEMDGKCVKLIVDNPEDAQAITLQAIQYTFVTRSYPWNKNNNFLQFNLADDFVNEAKDSDMSVSDIVAYIKSTDFNKKDVDRPASGNKFLYMSSNFKSKDEFTVTDKSVTFNVNDKLPGDTLGYLDAFKNNGAKSIDISGSKITITFSDANKLVECIEQVIQFMTMTKEQFNMKSEKVEEMLEDFWDEFLNESFVNEAADYELNETQCINLIKFLTDHGFPTSEAKQYLRKGKRIPTRYSYHQISNVWDGNGGDTNFPFALAFKELYMSIGIGVDNDNNVFIVAADAVCIGVTGNKMKLDSIYYIFNEDCTKYKKTTL